MLGSLIAYMVDALSPSLLSDREEGEVLRGTTTAALDGGSFNASNGKLNCGGSYNSLDTSPTISMPILCFGGRRGIIIATRDNSGTSGAGAVIRRGGGVGPTLAPGNPHSVQGETKNARLRGEDLMFGRAAAGF
jgi:hypothetical protein